MDHTVYFFIGGQCLEADVLNFSFYTVNGFFFDLNQQSGSVFKNNKKISEN